MFLKRNPPFVLLALYMQTILTTQSHRRTWPGRDQRPARGENPMRFPEHGFGLGQISKYCQHCHMIKLAAFIV